MQTKTCRQRQRDLVKDACAYAVMPCICQDLAQEKEYQDQEKECHTLYLIKCMCVSYTLSHPLHLIHLTCKVKVEMCMPFGVSLACIVTFGRLSLATIGTSRHLWSPPLFACLAASLTVSNARACNRKEAPTGWAWTRWKRLCC